jgi:hypothetical protein
MFLVKFLKKHQKNILILLFILAAIFLLNRQFRILEGAENRKVTIRPPPPRNPLISTGSSTSVPDNRKVTIRLPPRNPLISTGSSGGSKPNVSGIMGQGMTAAMKHICGVMPNAPGCYPK